MKFIFPFLLLLLIASAVIAASLLLGIKKALINV